MIAFSKNYLSSFNINKQTSKSTVMLIAFSLRSLSQHFRFNVLSCFVITVKKAPSCKQALGQIGSLGPSVPKVFDLRLSSVNVVIQFPHLMA